MSTVPTQIRIDSTTKERAASLFASLGLDMSSAVNIFLKACVARGGIPFPVELPNYKQKVLDAMEEAKLLAEDDSVPGFTDAKSLNKFLDSD